MRRRRRFGLLLLAALDALLLAGCQFVRLGSDLDRMSHFGVLAGTAEVEGWSGAPILVAVATRSPEWNAPFEMVAHVYLSEPGYFEFTLPPGSYYLGAVEDRDRGEDLDPDERQRLVPEPLAVRAEEWSAEITLVLELPQPDATPLALRDARAFVVGERGRLEDPRFARGEAEVGIWQPLHAMQRFAAGLFVLEDYDPARTPVVFVHGMGGTARDFRALIARLDSTRFQAWVFQYPTALPLELVAGGLASALAEMHDRYRFERACLVAHSMGGLVARRALGRLAGRGVPIRGFATLASPLAGVAGAESGVHLAPAVVPAWRDLSPGSDFLRGLYEPPLDASIPYTLLFAYQPGKSSDGAVEIASQLRAEAQLEADLVRGIPATHRGVLDDVRAATPLQELLERCRASGDASGPPPRADAAARAER